MNLRTKVLLVHFQPVMCERSWDSGLDLQRRDARRGELFRLYGRNSCNFLSLDLVFRPILVISDILLSLRWKPTSLLQGDDDEPEGLIRIFMNFQISWVWGCFHFFN